MYVPLWPSLVCIVVCGMVEWMWYGTCGLGLVCDNCGGDVGCLWGCMGVLKCRWFGSVGEGCMVVN